MLSLRASSSSPRRRSLMELLADDRRGLAVPGLELFPEPDGSNAAVEPRLEALQVRHQLLVLSLQASPLGLKFIKGLPSASARLLALSCGDRQEREEPRPDSGARKDAEDEEEPLQC